MKRQFKSFLRGLMVGVLGGLFIMYSGHTYVYQAYLTYMAPVTEGTDSTFVAEVDNGAVVETTTVATSSPTDMKNASSTDLATSTDVVTTIAPAVRLSVGLTSALAELDLALDNLAMPPSYEPLTAWFAATAPIEILAHEFELTSSPDGFCSAVTPVTETLQIRLADRAGYAKDRQAEAVDQYFALRTQWQTDVEAQRLTAQQAFAAAIIGVGNQSGILLNNQAFTTFTTNMESAYETYTKATTLNDDRLQSALRVLRDEKTASFNRLTEDYVTAVEGAITIAREQCAVGAPNQYLVLQSELDAARVPVAIKTQADAVAALFASHAASATAAKQALRTAYETEQAEL